MSSFGESSAVKKATNESSKFVNYNNHQISRTYPAGTRVNSSNYDPVPLWNAGCHMGKGRQVGCGGSSGCVLFVIVDNVNQST